MSSEGGRPLADAGKLHRLAGIVGRFHEAETGRQQEGPVEAQSAHGLLRHDIAAAVARDHHGVEPLARQSAADVEASEAVDEGHDVGAHRVVVIGEEEQQPVAVLDGGDDLL